MHNSTELLDDERDILMLATKETQSALRQYPINIQRQPWGNYKVTLINLPLHGHTRLFWKYLFMSLNCKVKSVFYKHSLTVHTLELPDDQGQPLKPPGKPRVPHLGIECNHTDVKEGKSGLALHCLWPPCGALSFSQTLTSVLYSRESFCEESVNMF